MVFHTGLSSETLPERSLFLVFNCLQFSLMEMRYSRIMKERVEGAEERKGRRKARGAEI